MFGDCGEGSPVEYAAVDGEGSVEDVLRDADPPADAAELWGLLLESLEALGQALILQVPVIALGLLLFVVGLILIKVGVGWTARGLAGRGSIMRLSASRST